MANDCKNCGRDGKHDKACAVCTVTADRMTGENISDPTMWIPKAESENHSFREVMKQMYRMTENRQKDGHLVFKGTTENTAGEMRVQFDVQHEKIDSFIEHVEENVLGWAAEHPGPVYPSWEKWQNAAFPKWARPICLRCFVGKEACGEMDSCEECRKQPIPADIAAKLHIEPIGGSNDEN